VIESRILLDGESVITEMNLVMESEDSPVAEGFARISVVKSEIVLDETEVSDARSELNVMDGGSVASKVLGVEDSGSTIELAITVELSSPVIDGKLLVGIGVGTVSSVGPELVSRGVEKSGRLSEPDMIDGKTVVSKALEVTNSGSLLELSITVGISDEAS